MTVPKDRLLAEFEELLRSLPIREALKQDNTESYVWLGRLTAAIEAWDVGKVIALSYAQRNLASPSVGLSTSAYRDICVLLNTARSSLALETLGPMTIPVSVGSVFDYFDEVRKLAQRATTELFYVDPYLDADFVSRYLPFTRPSVPVRLLTGTKRIHTLLPAIDTFVRQSDLVVTVRTSHTLHDRYIFLDRSECFQSGSSFKDGAAKAPTLITQIHDAFSAVWDSYEQLWSTAIVQR